MAQIVKTDVLHIVFFQEIIEVVRDEIGRQQIAELIDADVIEVFLIV